MVLEDKFSIATKESLRQYLTSSKTSLKIPSRTRSMSNIRTNEGKNLASR